MIGAIYYFFLRDTETESLDPLSCKYDDDCTYYSILNCTNSKPINKKYKTNVLNIVESEDSLCGQIKTACINYQCEIVK